MCGSRHTFSRTETKYFVGATEIPANQLREIPGYRFAELFPHRRDGFTLKYGVKPVQIPDRDRIPVAQQKEDHLATLGHWKHRRVEKGDMTEAQYAAEMAAAEKNWSPSSAFAYLVTNATPPQAIDRVIKWERKEKQTMCGAKCRNARGPNCDCICEGKYHGAGMTNSRTRFAASDLDFKPTAEMAANAARGLELREKHGKGGTAVGVARARDIKNRANLSPDTVKRMHSFFSRHEGNQAGGEDDAGYIAWLLWGGDAGKAWAARKAAQIDKSESARGAARKATMALNPVITDALKFHTQKMSDLLRQFVLEAKRLHTTYADLGAGKGFDSDWISEQRSIVDNAISAMARGNVTGASNIVRQWADEFFATYGHHEHSRNLSFLARAIAREPAHVVELAKAHKVTLSRRSRKATMARELVGSKGNKRIYLGGPDGSGKYNLYFVQVANTGVPGESPAEDLIELKQFATEAKARSAAQKMLSSRPGAKAKFAANSVDLWNFLSRNDTTITRQNKNDLALLKKYAQKALTLPDFTPPAHAQHGPSLHTMAKDVLAEIKAWEEQVYRYRNRAPWEASRPGASAFSLAAVKSAAAKVAAAYGTGEDSAVIRKHLDRIVSVLSGNTEGGRREAMGIHAQIGSVAERTHGRDFMWSAPMQGLESAIRSAGQFARPGAKAKFYTSPTKTGKNGPVTWDNLFVGHLGNGWTLANKGHEVSGDYERVAHIAYGGEVTFAPGFNQARLDPRVKAYIQKLSVEAAQKKSAGEPLARTGSGQGLYSRARFANWEITPTKKHGQPIEEHTAKIGGKYFKIDTMPHLGADFGSLYVWDDLRGLKPIASGRIAALKRQAEALATNDALSRIILGEFSRPGAKSTHAAEIVQKLSGGWVIEREGGILYLAKGNEAIPVPSVERALELHKASVEGRLARRSGGLMSRPGAKSNGLTLAQRIAVAHDAKRMALR